MAVVINKDTVTPGSFLGKLIAALGGGAGVGSAIANTSKKVGEIIDSKPNLTDVAPNLETKPLTEVNNPTNDFVNPAKAEIKTDAIAQEIAQTQKPVINNKPLISNDTDIKDTTNDNIETKINGIDMNWWEAQRNLAWEREDAIRKETQEREDTAYQRAVTDAIKSGINPNLININPAASGGGITNATELNEGLGSLMQNEYLLKLEKELEHEFEGDQNAYDRVTDILTRIISTIGTALIFKK